MSSRVSLTAAHNPGVQPCRWCGQLHGVVCPIVKSVEYFKDGVTLRRVEFKTAADYGPQVNIPSATIIRDMLFGGAGDTVI